MSMEKLVNPRLIAIASSSVEKGQVLMCNNESVLARAYTWHAGMAHLASDHMSLDSRREWCTLECFARFRFGSATQRNMEMARESIRPLATELARHGELLLIDYNGPNGAKCAMRIMGPEEDAAAAQPLLERMVKMRDTTVERVNLILSIIAAKRKLLECCSESVPAPEEQEAWSSGMSAEFGVSEPCWQRIAWAAQELISRGLSIGIGTCGGRLKVWFAGDPDALVPAEALEVFRCPRVAEALLGAVRGITASRLAAEGTKSAIDWRSLA
ncbi:MAG: hypothetical protein AB1486_25540 [Planctomycetota bacterium]